MKSTTLRETIGRRTAALRTARGLSQTQLAIRTARVGTDRLSAYVLGQIERGTRQTIGIDEVLALALALEVSPVNLLTDHNDIEVTDTVTVTPQQMRAWLAGEPLPTR